MAPDPRWPTAAAWLGGDSTIGSAPAAALVVAGFPSSARSISPSAAHTTPAAVRAALARYSTWSVEHDIDVREVLAVDVGDMSEPDAEGGFERSIAQLRQAAGGAGLMCVLGGDNSITYPVMLALHSPIGTGGSSDLSGAGLITFDAHHDLRDGWSNGSPVRQLVEAGVPGERVVQIGIADFANSREYTARARDLGITVITRGAAMSRPVDDVIAEALEIAGGGGASIHVDVDVDVCDRAVAPGCPASSPGGFSADLLRAYVYRVCLDHRVTSIDFTEVDTESDAADGRTVRLVALSLLESAAAYARRVRRSS